MGVLRCSRGRKSLKDCIVWTKTSKLQPRKEDTMKYTLAAAALVFCFSFSMEALAQDPASWRDAYDGEPVTQRSITGMHECKTMKDGQPCGTDH